MLLRLYDKWLYLFSTVYSHFISLIIKNKGNMRCWGRVDLINVQCIEVGSNVTLNHRVYINGAGGVKIGNNVALSAGCKIISTDLKRGAFNSKEHFSKPVLVGNNVQVGAGTIILAGVTICDNIVIGAGSVVTHNLEESGVYVGSPVRKISNI